MSSEFTSEPPAMLPAASPAAPGPAPPPPPHWTREATASSGPLTVPETHTIKAAAAGGPSAQLLLHGAAAGASGAIRGPQPPPPPRRRVDGGELRRALAAAAAAEEVVAARWQLLPERTEGGQAVVNFARRVTGGYFQAAVKCAANTVASSLPLFFCWASSALWCFSCCFCLRNISMWFSICSFGWPCGSFGSRPRRRRQAKRRRLKL